MYAILVIWHEGEEEYLKVGTTTTPARFSSRKAAKEQLDFMKIGMVEECQSINIVPYPRK